MHTLARHPWETYSWKVTAPNIAPVQSTMSRATASGLGAMLFAASMALSDPHPAGAAGSSLDAFAGDYEHAGSPAQARRQIDRAIADVTDDMGFLKSGVAEDRLEEGTGHVPRIAIRVWGKDVRIRLHDVEYRARIDGSEQTARSKTGETVRVRHRFRNGRLVQLIGTGKGHRKNIFTLEDGGRSLRMTVVISSRHLPHDVRYDAVYRRR